MQYQAITKTKTILALAMTLSLGNAVPVSAQEPAPAPPPPTTGWRRFGPPAQPANQARPQSQPPIQYEQQPADPGDQPPPPNQAPPPQQQPQSNSQQGLPPIPMPQGPLVLPAGSWITVRVNQVLSSDHNQQGDTFTATLAQPLVVSGLVVARRGQTVAGVVAGATKAGRVKGTSSLALELTELSLADGRQVQIRTKLTERRGNTSNGTDAAAIGTTAGVGAAIGAVADGGFGAGMGAIAGAGAATIGVLLTRGQPTVVHPEQMLTFRVEAPVTVAADAYSSAFQPVYQEDYDSRPPRTGPSLQRRPPVMYPYPYPYYGYYPYWGPSFYFYSGPRYYHGWRRW